MYLVEEILLYIPSNQASPLVNTFPQRGRLLQLRDQLVFPPLQLVSLLHTVPVHGLQTPFQGHQSVHEAHHQADNFLNLLKIRILQ